MAFKLLFGKKHPVLGYAPGKSKGKWGEHGRDCKIKGQRWHFWAQFGNKTMAQKEAEKMRSRGFNARVIRSGDYTGSVAYEYGRVTKASRVHFYNIYYRRRD